MSISLRWLQAGAFNVQAVSPLPPPKFIRRLGILSQTELSEIEVTLKRWEGLA